MFLTGVWSFIPSKYYEKEALLADPVCGPILASLLGEFLQSYLFYAKENKLFLKTFCIMTVLQKVIFISSM